MSDEDIRAAERTYRTTGNPADGEAWIQAVMRTTGLPVIPLITQVIRTQRALHAVALAGGGSPYSNAMQQPVTPYDIVSFLRGGSEWLKSEHRDPRAAQTAWVYDYRCIEPDCDQLATEQGFYPHPVLCWAHYCLLHQLDPALCGVTPSFSVVPCTFPREHQGPHQGEVEHP